MQKRGFPDQHFKANENKITIKNMKTWTEGRFGHV